MNKLKFNNLNVGQVVAEDFRTSNIFTNAGIDYCCGGTHTVEQACAEKGVDIDQLEMEIQKIKETPLDFSDNYKEWDLPFLIDYIKNTHHKYVLQNLPELVFLSDKIANVHGENHPELTEIAEKVNALNKELRQHLKNEEEVLFPAIKDFLKDPVKETSEIIRSEIDRMLGEHDFAGGTMDEINKITHGYELPEDACNTYTVAFKTLNHFENDLHKHVHLENNILFPKALDVIKNQNKN